MLLPYYSIGSSADKIEKELIAEFKQHFKPAYISKPNMYLPIILPESIDKIFHGYWGINNTKEGMNNAKKTSIIWVRKEGILKNRNTRAPIRNQRCLIPSNGFFVKHEEKYFFIYFPKEPVITLAGIYQFDQVRRKNETLTLLDHPDIRFILLTKSSSPRFSKITSRMPVIISRGSRRKFLNLKKPMMDITHLLQREINLDFNGIEVSPELFMKKSPGKPDFHRKTLKLYAVQKFPQKEILGSLYYH